MCVCVHIQLYVCTHVLGNIDHQTMISCEQETKQLTAILPLQLEALARSHLPGHLLYTSLPATHTLLPQCPFMEPVQWPTGLPEEPGVDIDLGRKKILFAFF